MRANPNNTSNRPLTEEERIFAEKNHNQLIWFLRRHHLDIEEYYDICVFGFLKACKDKHEFKRTEEYAFSTLVNRSAMDCVYKYWRYLNAVKRGKDLTEYSLDWKAENEPDGTESELYDLIPDKRDDYEEIIACDLKQRIYKKLPFVERQILNMLIQDYTKREIKETLGIRQEELQERIAHIQEVTRQVAA